MFDDLYKSYKRIEAGKGQNTVQDTESAPVWETASPQNTESIPAQNAAPRYVQVDPSQKHLVTCSPEAAYYYHQAKAREAAKCMPKKVSILSRIKYTLRI